MDCVTFLLYIPLGYVKLQDIIHGYGEGNGTPLQYSCLENLMDAGAWKAAVHGVTEGRTRLSNFTFTFHFPALEKEMATHSSVLAWRISGTGEPGGLPSMGSHRVRHDWSDLAAAAAAAAAASVTLGSTHPTFRRSFLDFDQKTKLPHSPLSSYLTHLQHSS